VIYAKEKGEYVTYVERGWGKRELLPMSDSAASVIYLTTSVASLRSDGLMRHKRHRLYLKCLEELQKQVPHT
jgi:hypothetical protein